MNPLHAIALDIDPINATTEAYKVGGIALVALIVLGLVIYLMGRFLFGQIHKLGTRLNTVEDTRNKDAVTVIAANTASNTAVVHACQEQTKTLDRLITVMGERPCFTTHTIPAIPAQNNRQHRTPLPQKYNPQ